MKAYLLFKDRDFDFGADLPAGHQDLIQDLELTTLLQAMAAGDKFLYGVSTKVLLASLEQVGEDHDIAPLAPPQIDHTNSVYSTTHRKYSRVRKSLTGERK